MRTLSLNRLFVYLGWLLGGILLWFLINEQFLANPLIFSLGFLYILFLPGFSLGRLLKLENFSSSTRLLLYFVLGLAFYLVISFFAILFGTSLSFLSILLIGLIILLFVGAFLDDFRQGNFKLEFFKFKFSFDYIFYLLILIIVLFVLWVIYLKAPNLNGDPYFHLAIIRKALEGDSLSVRDLAFTKTQFINPTYAYPAWHVFLAFISRLFLVDIFTTWANIIFPLAIISFFSWHYLAKVIFEKKFLALLGLLLWMILTFYDGAGYLFTRLGVPDTFAQLILLPLGFAFTLKYIFIKDSAWRFLAVTFLIALMLLLLHGPHYFYLLLVVFAYTLFYAAVYFKEKDYKLILLRLLKVFLIELSVLIIVGILMEIRSRTLSATILEFNKLSEATIAYSSFFKFSLVYKYAFFLLPIVFVFSRPRWWLISINMLLIPLIYFTSLKDFFSRFLSIVFTDRLLSNLAWYFFVFSTVLAIILYFVDFVLNRLSQNVRLIVNILLSLIFPIFVFWEIKNQAISDFTYKILYAKETNAFVNAHYLWFFLILLFLAAVLLSMRFIWKKSQLLTFSEEPKNHPTMFLLVLMISFVLISPSIVNVRYFLKQPRTLQGEEYFLAALQNDRSALNYLKTKTLQKSVVLASGGATKELSTLAPQYMAYNAGSAYEKKFQWVFDSGTQDSAKAEIVTSSQWAIDYVYLDQPVLQNKHFRAHPEIYQLIYKNKTEIYRVIKK